VIKPAYSFSFLLTINIFQWQNVLYFLFAPRIFNKRFKICNTVASQSYGAGERGVQGSGE